MGTGAPRSSGRVSPKSPSEGRTSGRRAAGIPRASRSSGSQARVWRLKNKVRLALVGSVAKTFPPVRFQMSQVSTVPKQTSPLSARALRPGTFSKSYKSFVPEK